MQRKGYKLAKAKTGRFELRWSEWSDERGRWLSRSVSTGTTSLAQAEAFRAEFLRQEEIADGRAASSGPTVGDLMDAYWTNHLAPSSSRNTGKVPTATKTQFGKARAWFGAMIPMDITPERVAEYRTARGVAEATTKKELGHVVAALNWAVKRRMLDAADKPHIDVGRDSAPRELFLDEDQEQEFLAMAYGRTIGKARVDPVTLFVAIALDTAARKQAILDLTWDRVDLRRGLIDFRVPGHVYTKKRRAVVPVSDRLRPVLERAKHQATSGQVFVQDIQGSYAGWVATTPYPWATPHVLRHTWATLAARSGESLENIALVLADSIVTVERVYRHHSPVWLRSTVNRRWA